MIHDIQYIEGSITAPQGFRAAGVKARIKYDKKDLALIASEVPAAAAGVFTTNAVKAAPVVLSKQHIAGGRAQAVVVNSGCANAWLWLWRWLVKRQDTWESVLKML